MTPRNTIADMTYDQLDSFGAIVRSNVVLNMYDELPPGHMYVEHVPSIEDVRVAQRLQVEQWRDAACVADVSVAVNGVAYPWQADKRSQELLSTAVSLAALGVIPAPAVWRNAVNQDIPVTLQDLKSIAAYIAYQTNTAYSYSWGLKKRINDALTVSDILAIQW